MTAAVLLPPIYLVLHARPQRYGRARGADAARRRRRARAHDPHTVTVTATCVALAVPLAWLVMRTDLPGAPRARLPVLALPLAVPSFVGGYVMISALGPGGLLQGLLEPLGVERLPSIYGFWGAWVVLSALSYPYIFLQTCAALRRVDPALEEAARSLGSTARGSFFRVSLPLLRPAVSAGHPRQPLRAERVRRGLDAALRHPHAADLRPLRHGLRPRDDSRARRAADRARDPAGCHRRNDGGALAITRAPRAATLPVAASAPGAGPPSRSAPPSRCSVVACRSP